jgi:hypothetical protein
LHDGNGNGMRTSGSRRQLESPPGRLFAASVRSVSGGNAHPFRAQNEFLRVRMITAKSFLELVIEASCVFLPGATKYRRVESRTRIVRARTPSFPENVGKLLSVCEPQHRVGARSCRRGVIQAKSFSIAIRFCSSFAAKERASMKCSFNTPHSTIRAAAVILENVIC